MRTLGLPEMLVILGVFIIVPLAALIVVYLIRHLQTKERIRAIEKGVPVPLVLGDPWERAVRTRRWGIVLVAAGLGLLVFFGVISTMDFGGIVGMAFAAIPILIGLGLVYEYRLRARELSVRSPVGTPSERLLSEEQLRK